MPIPEANERSKGGGYMPKKKWYTFGFYFEIALECPGDTDEFTAAEDAASFAVSLGHAMARVGDNSFASVIRIDECGHLRPSNFPVILDQIKPSGRHVNTTLPRGVVTKPDFYEKRVVKSKPKKKKIQRRT